MGLSLLVILGGVIYFLLLPMITISEKLSPSSDSLLEDDHSHNSNNAVGSSRVGMCRHREYYPPVPFELHTCAHCYKYIPDGLTTFGIPSQKLSPTPGQPWNDPGNNISYPLLGLEDINGTRIFANASDTESPLRSTFVTEAAKKDWLDCCEAARECCSSMTSETLSHNLLHLDDINPYTTQGECPPTWDGWQCWGRTPAGHTAKSYCPHYIYALTEPSCQIPLEKKCTEDGVWARRSLRFKNGTIFDYEEWTNYSGCGTAPLDIQLRRTYVHVVAYAISIVAILPALVIFFSYKQLRVHRIILHQNLFISMLMNGIFVIVFKTVVILSGIQQTNTSMILENHIGCRLLLIITKYSRMTNYMWMFCEGYYLHKLIAAAFAEQKSLLVFYLIGWGFPVLPTAAYAIYRLTWANEKCWILPEDPWEWVLNAPSLLSLLLNGLFLINIIRVLVTKLRATHTQEPSQYRKAVRATLVLLPLFGLHFIVTIYRPPSSTGVCIWTEIYFYANDVLDGIQGFLVALIFCYCNGEVSALLKRTYLRIRDQYRPNGWCGSGGARSPRRRGSLLGRSVVSTHVYSSVPPSPEANNLGGVAPSPSSAPTNLLTVNGKSAGPDSSLLKPNNNARPLNLYVTSDDKQLDERTRVDITSV